jgi:hypothetical protein
MAVIPHQGKIWISIRCRGRRSHLQQDTNSNWLTQDALLCQMSIAAYRAWAATGGIDPILFFYPALHIPVVDSNGAARFHCNHRPYVGETDWRV